MVQITGQHARIAALSMLTASNRDYPRSTPSRWWRTRGYWPCRPVGLFSYSW